MYWARQIEEKFHKYVWRRLAIFAAEDVSIANPMCVVTVNACWQAYDMIRKDGKKGDGDLLAMAVLTCARSPKCRESNHLYAVVGERMKRGWQPEVPDYALDGHTARGKQLHPVSHERHVSWYLNWSWVEQNTGPNDYLLWHMRRMVQTHELDAAFVEAKAEEWESKGQLWYGLYGMEPFTDDRFDPVQPIVDVTMEREYKEFVGESEVDE